MSANTDPATGEVVIGAMDESQLELIVDRFRRDFHVEASLSRPVVAYKETLTRQADGEVRLSRQVGGRRVYAHVKLRVEPGEPGSGYVFANEIAGGAVPQDFFKPVDEGIKEALAVGVLTGYPVDDVRVVLYDGSYHQSDSSEWAFMIAGAMAFNDAARQAKPIVIEPVMRVEVRTPVDYMGDVIGDLASRRGHIESQDDCDGMRRVVARVPLSEMFGYAADLRYRTRGRGTFAMQFECYEPRNPAENQEAGGDSMVRAPLKPLPTLLDASVALPEPIDDDRREGAWNYGAGGRT